VKHRSTGGTARKGYRPVVLSSGRGMGSSAYADRHRLSVGMFQPFEHDEGFVRTVFGAGPPVAGGGIEEIGQYTVWAGRMNRRFQDAGTLKFSQTF